MTKVKLNRSLLNFIWLFTSSLAIKGLGVVRESVVAYEVGNTMEFATFNALRAVVDFFLAFVIGVPIVESILVPKYAHQYLNNNSVNFLPLWKQTVSASKYLCSSMILLLLVITLLRNNALNPDVILWILLFSAYLGMSLLSSVLFSLQKTVGNFRKYSTQSFLNAFINLIIIFALIGIIGLKAIIFSGIVAIIFSNFFLKRSLRLNLGSNLVPFEKSPIQWSDVNFYKFISVNHAIFIGFTGRLLIGFGNDYQINLYQYSFIIISSFMMMVVSNISSIILYKSATNSNSVLLKAIILTFLAATLANTCLYYFGDIVIKLLYQRGKFTEVDTQKTSEFLKIFLIPYTVFAITQVMIQPFVISQSKLTEISQQPLRRIGQIIFITIIIAVGTGIITNDFKLAVLTLLYTASFGLLAYLGIQLKINSKYSN